MVKKILFISLALLGLLFSIMLGGCFADAAAQMDVVISNLELGNDAEAEAETKKLIVDFAGHPHLPDVLYQVANKYQGRQKHEQAIKLYQYIADTWPESDRALPAQMNVVISNLELGKDSEAQAATGKLVADFAVHPDLPDVLYLVANEYQGHQIHEQAQKLYKYIVDNLPKSEYVILSRGGIIMADISLGNYANAQAAIDKLILDFNGHPALPGEIYRIASYLYWGEKRYEDARRLYKYIVANLPESEYVILSRGGVIMADISLGNDTNAQAAIDSLIADFSDNPLIARVLWDTAQAYRDLKKYEKAIELYQYVIDNWPKAEHAISSQMSVAEINVRSLIESGKDTVAQAALDSLINDFKGHPALPEALFEIGEQYYYKAFEDPNRCVKVKSEEHLKKAKAVWEKIITELPPSNPHTAHAYFFSAACYRKLGEHKKAVEYFQGIVDNWPDYQYAWSAQSLIGSCYEKLRNSGSLPASEANPKIEQAYEAVVEKYPDCSLAAHACLKLGQINLEKGQRVVGAEFFKLFLEMANPRDPRIESVEAKLENLKGDEQ